MDKTTLRIISKVGLLLVIMSFFMPMACDQNAFEIAEYSSGYDGPSALSISLYVTFAFSCLGGLLLLLLALKKTVSITYDWIDLVVVVTSGIIAFTILREDYHFFSLDHLQSGAYFFITGLTVSLVFLIIASTKQKESNAGSVAEINPKQPEKVSPAVNEAEVKTVSEFKTEKKDNTKRYVLIAVPTVAFLAACIVIIFLIRSKPRYPKVLPNQLPAAESELRQNTPELESLSPVSRTEYQGTMVKGGTTLNIKLSLGGFVNRKPLDAYYAYTKYNTPIPLEGEINPNGTLFLSETDTDVTGIFEFENFSAADPILKGIWFTVSNPDSFYKVTLVKE